VNRYAGRYPGDVHTRLVWRTAGPDIVCGERTLVMGVVNVTPDSFSDGGRYLDPEGAVAHGIRLTEEGADVLDVGGESTRPGSEPVSVQEEMDRVLPVIKRLAAEVDTPISIDTRKPAVATAAIESGAVIVNDVSGAREPGMLEAVLAIGAGLILMHMHGEPKTMQEAPLGADHVVDVVRADLAGRIGAALDAGVDRRRLAIDPGLGFGKTAEASLRLMRDVQAFLDFGLPLVMGPSRKSFIGLALEQAAVDDRLEGTAAAVAYLAARGAHVVRVHDVREMVRVVRVVDAIAGS
jgi:dihydropteroate synthase